MNKKNKKKSTKHLLFHLLNAGWSLIWRKISGSEGRLDFTAFYCTLMQVKNLM